MEKTKNWVFLRGLARHSLHWGPFPDFFKAQFPEAQIEMIDLRGNGSQAHVPSFTSIQENVRDLRSRSSLLAEGKVNLLTISLGSMVGIEWATMYPREISSLVCTNTSDSANSKIWDRLMPRNYGTILKTLLPTSDPLAVERNIMKMISPGLPESEKWIEIFSKASPTSHQNLVRQLLAARTFKLPATKPPCPLLLLASRGDPFVSPECSERIGKAWDQPVIWHPSAGHDIQLEDPAWVCEQIAENITD